LLVLLLEAVIVACGRIAADTATDVGDVLALIDVLAALMIVGAAAVAFVEVGDVTPVPPCSFCRGDTEADGRDGV